MTALVPGPIERLWAEPVPAGVAVLNGAGELTGSLQIAEWGRIETPVYLTATMSVGRVYDGAVAAAMAAEPRIGVDAVVIPVVGECDDSWLNDPRVAQVEAERRAASAGRRGRLGVRAQGAVGAGTGMVCFDWKGGIGSSSRVTGAGHTVGVLVLANYGDSSDLRIDGVPVGRLLGRRASIAAPPAAASRWWPPTRRSDRLSSRESRAGPASASREPAPWRTTGAARSSSRSRPRRARRATSRLRQALADGELDPLFLATVDATEEAVLNALWAAETTSGRDGRVVERLPHEPVLELLARHGRLGG